MSANHLLTEGDVNFSSARKDWYTTLDTSIAEALHQDREVFLHQALSTPCLDVLEACDGIYLTDISGKRYMDFHGNNVHQIGYRNNYVLKKVVEQMNTLPFSPRRFTNAPAIELAKKLTSLLPIGLSRVLFAPGGTSAVGMALKLARVITGKQRVVCLRDSFHGASLDAIAAGDEEQFKKYMGPMNFNHPIAQPVTYRNTANDGNDLHYAEALNDILKKDNTIGAFIAETVRNTDVQIPSKEYWQRVREICSAHRVLLILDEIPIAFGRTGKMFAFEHYDITPDILCLGKGLGAGVIPIAAMICREEYNVASEVSLGHYTHEKSPLGAVAGLAMLEVIQNEKLLEKVVSDEIYVRAQLLELKRKHNLIGDVRGVGLLWGIELVRDQHTKTKAVEEAEAVMYECLKNGLSFKVSQGNVLQLSPPLIISRPQLNEVFGILDRAIDSVSRRFSS